MVFFRFRLSDHILTRSRRRGSSTSLCSSPRTHRLRSSSARPWDCWRTPTFTVHRPSNSFPASECRRLQDISLLLPHRRDQRSRRASNVTIHENTLSIEIPLLSLGEVRQTRWHVGWIAWWLASEERVWAMEVGLKEGGIQSELAWVVEGPEVRFHADASERNACCTARRDEGRREQLWLHVLVQPSKSFWIHGGYLKLLTCPIARLYVRYHSNNACWQRPR